MNINKIIKQFATIGIGTIASMILGFVSTLIITRIVPPTEYGVFSIFTAYAMLAISFLCLGQDQSLLRFFYDMDCVEYKRALLFKCIRIPFGVCSFFLLFMLSISNRLAPKVSWEKEWIIAFAFYVTILVIYRYGQVVVRLNYKTKLYSLLTIIQKSVYLSIVLCFIWRGGEKYTIVLMVATIISYLFCTIVAIVGQWDTWSFHKVRRNHCVIPQKTVLIYGFPFIISTAIDSLFSAFDRIALEHWGTYADVGVYASASSLASIFAVCQTTFCTLWSPLAFENYAKDKEDRNFYKKGFNNISLIMFLVAVNVIFFKDILVFLLGQKYREAAQILPFLIFQPLMYTVSETTGSGLYFAQKSNLQIGFTFIACVSNIIGNVVLVPIIGAKGAAMSTGIAYIVFFAFRTFFSQRVFSVDYRLTSFYIMTSVLIIYAIMNTFWNFGVWNIIGYAVCMIVLAICYRTEISIIYKQIRKMIISKEFGSDN